MLLKDNFHPGKIRIFLADDHSIVRKQLALRLNSEPDIDVVGVAATSLETFQKIQMTHPINHGLGEAAPAKHVAVE